jgi:hypothetical protein
MRAYELKNDASFDDLYQSLDEIGCAVRFSAFLVGDAGGTSVVTHREAALRMLEQQRDEVDSYFNELLQRQEYQGRHRSEFFFITIFEDLLGPGARISVAEFLGPGCDLAGRKLLLRGQTKNHLNHLFWSGDEENFQNAVKTHVDDGFTHAFLNPPYSLFGLVNRKPQSLPNKEKHRLFFKTVDRLLGGLAQNCVIYRWSEDSSNFFDAGKEWWGTYFYTVFVPDSSRIVGIIASETD